MRFLDVSRVRSQFDVRFPARDGVELSVDIYRPAEDGEYSVLLTRTPYDNNRADQRPPASTAPQVPSDRFKVLAASGYIVVAGDVRGRGDSDGEFVPFVHEASDGADTVTWARGLSGANGRVGAFGSGYAGFTALASAAASDVDALAVWSPFNAGEGLPARGGALRLDWLFWLHLVGGRVRGPADVPPWQAIFRTRPLSEMQVALGRADSPWPHWVEHLDPQDAFWSCLDLSGALATTAAPTLLVTGWWDSESTATLKYWDVLSSSPAASLHQLVVGPWDSARTRKPASEMGAVDWGPTSVVDPIELLLGWFDGHLRDRSPTSQTSPTAQIRAFVTGRNAWTGIERSQRSATAESLWLTSEGRANTRVGDGRLQPDRAGDAGVDRFVHDPANPVCWQPGSASFSRSEARAFTLETSFATSRDDTLTYTSDPVAAPKLIAGVPVVHLFAETDLDDADWVVSLEDVFPGDTRALHLTHGIVRAGTSTEFTLGRPVRYRICMNEVMHELQPGHALRLVVTSSLFPLYAINLGGSDYTGGVESRRGRHAVFHGPVLPSRLDLPLPRKDCDDQTS